MPSLAALGALLGLAFAAVVLPGGIAGATVVLAVGLAAQLVATAVLTWLPSRPDLGMAATLLVAALLAIVPTSWQQLLAAQAVPWVPVAVTWATVRVLGGARSPRQLQVSAVLVAAYLLALGASASGDPTSAVFDAAVPLLGGLSVSLAVRLRRARADRAAALAAERKAMAYRARSDERQRIAAHLHDDLGHVLTLVVLHANALATTAQQADARRAGEQISGLGTQGLSAMRRALGLIDAPVAAITPLDMPGPRQPGEPVRELVDRARAAGQDIALTLPDPTFTVDAAVSGAVERAVREGLTNARKYAPDAPVELSLATDAEQLRLAVVNGPSAAAGTADGTLGSGRGLAALRRGIDLLGGRCEHAPTTEGGYALRVQLPADPTPPAGPYP